MSKTDQLIGTCKGITDLAGMTAEHQTHNLTASLETERELRQCAEKNLQTLCDWLQGRGDGWPLSGHAYTIRQEIVRMSLAAELKATRDVIVEAGEVAADQIKDRIKRAETYLETLKVRTLVGCSGASESHCSADAVADESPGPTAENGKDDTPR